MQPTSMDLVGRSGELLCTYSYTLLSNGYGTTAKQWKRASFVIQSQKKKIPTKRLFVELANLDTLRLPSYTWSETQK